MTSDTTGSRNAPNDAKEGDDALGLELAFADEEDLSEFSAPIDLAAMLQPDQPVIALPLRSMVLFPHSMASLHLRSPQQVSILDDVMRTKGMFVAVMLKDAATLDPAFRDLLSTGTLCWVVRVQPGSDGSRLVLVRGLCRVRLVGPHGESSSPLQVRLAAFEEVEHEGDEVMALKRAAVEQLERLRTLVPLIPAEVIPIARRIRSTARLADLMASLADLTPDTAQELLEECDSKLRLQHVIEFLEQQLHVIALGREIQDRAKQSIDDRQTEAILREQLEAIQERLGDDGQRTVHELKKKLDRAGLSGEAREEADRELSRLARIPAMSPEYNMNRTYLEWLSELPWSRTTDDNLDLRHAKTILDEDHFGLDEVKDRIIEFLAIRRLRADARSPILCFAGPPGTGKTSLGRSIARALGRSFVRQSLGGIRDEAEIRGHRRTYIGALPGRIITALRRAGSRNPVLMLDEIDKVGHDMRGDPHAALLEVLDPEQNSGFVDHYLGIAFDLSQVMFVCTANVLDSLPDALRDRLEVLSLPGYTPVEKREIAKQFLIPRCLTNFGMENLGITISDRAIDELTDNYTRDAGMRGLDRVVGKMLRKVARGVALDEPAPECIGVREVQQYLGARPFLDRIQPPLEQPGAALGLAWTPGGGEVLLIEAAAVPGSRSLILTGQIGDVMRESAMAALTYVRGNIRRFGVEPSALDHLEIHLHVPAGAIPKDGPSAGLAICVALASLVSGRMPTTGVAMTGEITLRGNILPVGGIEHKILGGHRLGLHTIVLPRGNEHSLDRMPKDVLRSMELKFVDDVESAIAIALQPTRHPGSAKSRPHPLEQTLH